LLNLSVESSYNITYSNIFKASNILFAFSAAAIKGSFTYGRTQLTILDIPVARTKITIKTQEVLEMATGKKVKQLSFTLPTRAGLLADVTSALANAKVNITAICAYEMAKNAYFMLTTDSAAKARKCLAFLRIGLEEEDVVVVKMPNKVGELQKVAKRIADAGINIDYMYGTAAAGRSSTCVFKTSDDKKAIGAINKKDRSSRK
jgi:hypothetical protein